MMMQNCPIVVGVSRSLAGGWIRQRAFSAHASSRAQARRAFLRIAGSAVRGGGSTFPADACAAGPRRRTDRVRAGQEGGEPAGIASRDGKGHARTAAGIATYAVKKIAILLDFAARSNLPGGGNDARGSAVRTDGADAAGIAHARASGRGAGRARP